jgi:hypothetical protein
LSPCSLEDLACYLARHLSEVLLKRHCLCLFTFVPKQVKTSMRQLADHKDMQSIPRYSVESSLCSHGCVLMHWDTNPRSCTMYSCVRVLSAEGFLLSEPTLLCLKLSLTRDKSCEVLSSLSFHQLHLSPSMARLRANHTSVQMTCSCSLTL